MIHFLITITILGLFSLITSKVSFLKRYRIPVSLSSSILFLFFFTGFPEYKNIDIFSTWKNMPSEFIALVFSSLFLETREKKNQAKSVEVFLEAILLWVTILGQQIIGITLTLFIFHPFFDLPIPFSSILEGGFAGGHGTAVAMKEVYIKNGFPNGMDYNLVSATIGIMLGIIGGVYLIKKENVIGHGDASKDITEFPLELNSILISLLLIFSAYLSGKYCKTTLESIFPTLPTFPLFVYSLAFSVSIKYILIFTNQTHLINNRLNSFFSTFFMEILIFTGIVTIDLQLVSEGMIPMTILFSLGFFWNIFSFYILSKYLIPKEYRFELNLINFGMLNGTTAIGLMLLRMVDPELKSKASIVYAESAPFTAPFLGGGLITFTLPYLLTHQNPYLILGILIISNILIYITGRYLYKSKIEQGYY